MLKRSVLHPIRIIGFIQGTIASRSKPTDSLDDIEDQGVGLDAWLARDPKEPLPAQEYEHELELFWQRNFYPVLDDVVTDLASRGLLEPGEYVIDISW